MVPQLDLSGGARARLLRSGDQRLLWLAAMAVAGLGLAAVAAYFCGWGLLLLAGSVAAGAGLTCWSGLDLALEERLAYGAVIGPMASTLAAFVASLAAGLTLASVLLGLAVALAGGVAAAWRERALVRPELAAFRSGFRSRWPLWLLLAVTWAYALHILGQAFISTAGGLDAGLAGVYGDWAAHLTFASSFAYGGNFPPQYPVDPGHPMSYPFLVDFWASELVPLGVSLPSALVLTSGLLMLALPAVIYLAGVRLTGRRGGSALGAVIFLCSGGFGFWYFLPDLQAHGLASLGRLPHLYTQNLDANYQLLTPVLAYLVPQRSILFGLPLALIAAALLWTGARTERPRRPFLFTGVVVGLAPLFHVHGYGTALALGGAWALLQRRRAWLWYLVPAALLGLPVVAWLLAGGGGSLRWLPGWYANLPPHQDGGLVFWLKNLGLFIPLLLVAQFSPGLLPNGFALWFAPIWLWFLVPNFVVFQPWEWDNTKYFVFFLLFGSLLVGAAVAELGRRPFTAPLAVALLVVLTLSGALDLARTADLRTSASGFVDRGGLAAAAYVRDHTDRRATLLVAPNHNEPVAMFSGRPLVVGYGGWLWTYGLKDWNLKTQDATSLLRGQGDVRALLGRYRVDYVVIGPQELSSQWGADAAYWARTGELVYSKDGYAVYRVSSLWR